MLRVLGMTRRNQLTNLTTDHQFSPSVLSHAPGPDFEQQVLLQHTLEYDRSTQISHDTDGLNLNVTVPLAANGEVAADAKLPVFCFIHGGGFSVGSSSFPQYDMTRLVQLSIESEAPIIAISLKWVYKRAMQYSANVSHSYRLSGPGFLTSEELRLAGYLTNNAFRDQRAALEWIHKYISGFGGDAQKITLMGESAGAISVNYHLLSQEPLFNRMMLMSGSALLLPAISLEAAEANYRRATEVLGLGCLTAEQRIQALLTMDGIELSDKLLQSGIPFIPVHDHDVLDVMQPPTFENVTAASLEIPGRTWCKAAIVGDCQFDGNIQFLRLAHREKDIASQIYTSFTSSLGSEETAKIVLQSYDISLSTPDQDAFRRILHICTDIQFYAPTLSLASNLGQIMPTYVYRFNEPNPWPGKFQGEAIHIQDLTWLFQNYNEYLVDEKQREQARVFARGVIRFVNGRVGEHAWKPWRTVDKQALVIGPEGRIGVVKDEAPGNGRRKTIVELAGRFGMDVLSEALGRFIDGK